MAAQITPSVNADPRPRAGRKHRHVGNVEPLTPKQERQLAIRIERGDFDAKTHMIEANLRLVASIAHKSTGPGLPSADLFQEGVIGLIRAAEKFDYRKGHKFSTYASLWIRESIHRGLQKKGRIVYLPADVWRAMSRIRRCRATLTQQLGREPHSHEIAAKLRMPEEEVKAVTQAFREAVSLNAAKPGAEDIELGETLLDTNSPAPDREGQAAALKRAVARSLGALESKPREVIELRYGVGRQSGECTVTQAAARLKSPRSELLRLEREAMARLSLDGSLAAWTSDEIEATPRNVRRAA